MLPGIFNAQNGTVRHNNNNNNNNFHQALSLRFLLFVSLLLFNTRENAVHSNGTE